MKEYVVKFTDSLSNGLLDHILTDEKWAVVEDLVSTFKIFVAPLTRLMCSPLVDSQGHN